MEKDSIIHVKVPRELHMNVKIRAMQEGKSMNEYVAGKLEEATRTVQKSDKYIEMVEHQVQAGIKAATMFGTVHDISIEKKSAREPEDTIVLRNKTVVSERDAEAIKKADKGEGVALKDPVTTIKGAGVNLCKVHGVPLTINGKCLMKGCKYA